MVQDYHKSMNGIYSDVLTVSSKLEDSILFYKIRAKFNGATVTFQHDSGAAVTVISKKVWHIIGRPRIYPSDLQIQSYNRMIPVIGQCNVIVEVEKQIQQQWAVIVPHGEDYLAETGFNVLMFDCKAIKLEIISVMNVNVIAEFDSLIKSVSKMELDIMQEDLKVDT
uniref:Uncharacterized protein n=1 Tax=Panagrolaimus sp. ES5 TaxID=591445 RepID=A0AC34G3V2_9BILA